MKYNVLTLNNGAAAPLEQLPLLEQEDFRQLHFDRIASGSRVVSFFLLETGGSRRIVTVLGTPSSGKLEIASAAVGDSFKSMAAEIPALQLFEREIAEQYSVVPEGHPWLKPVRYHKSRTQDAPEPQVGIRDFYRMDGGAVHEVAVGPIHAGVIEPGHFRFQCMGEKVYNLEISLGYQHRGIEKLMENAPLNKAIHYAETAAGDSTAAAATAFCTAVEALAGIEVSGEALAVRQIAMELERIANHTGDLGALAGDVAFLPTASFCGRIRGEYLNMTAEICGNRFGRGLVRPGGCTYGISPSQVEKLAGWIQRVHPELDCALNLMFDSPTVLDRLENTGTVFADTARTLGLVGIAARASALNVDSRRDFPMKNSLDSGAEPAVDLCGDVAARAEIRRREIAHSHKVLERLLRKEGWTPAPSAGIAMRPEHIAVAVTEAWRGELAYTVVTDSKGNMQRCKITDPSFHNWEGLAMALRGEEISNFPICNKSFNLSYCGHDL